MEQEQTTKRQEVLGLLAWLAMRRLLRLLLLDRWSLWGDEYYSLSPKADSLRTYPLFFQLENWARDLLPGSLSLEFRLRLVPALAGAAAVALMFAAPRGLMTLRERHLLAAMTAASPWLLYHSQFARFYSLLLLLSAAATFWFLRALKSDSWKGAIAALVVMLLAILTHPSALLLLGSQLAAGFLARLLGQVSGRRAVLPPLVLVGLAALYAMSRWESVQSTIGYKLGLLDSGADSVPDLVQGIAYNLGLPLCLLAVLGLPFLARRSRLLFLYVVVAAGLPTLSLLYLAAQGTPVEQRYLIPAVPLILVPAAVMLARLSVALRDRVPLAAVAVPVFALLSFAPGLVSHYIDGNRHDLRGAIRWIADQWQEGDALIAETHALAYLYLPEREETDLLEAEPVGADRRTFQRFLAERRRIWIVLPDFFQELGGHRGSFYRWAWQEGALVREMYRPRLDYHQNRLHVFRIDDPAAASNWNQKAMPAGF